MGAGVQLAPTASVDVAVGEGFGPSDRNFVSQQIQPSQPAFSVYFLGRSREGELKTRLGFTLTLSE